MANFEIDRSEDGGGEREVDLSAARSPSGLQEALNALDEFTLVVEKIEVAVTAIEQAQKQALAQIERQRITTKVLMAVETVKSLHLINVARLTAIMGSEDTPGIRQAREEALQAIQVTYQGLVQGLYSEGQKLVAALQQQSERVRQQLDSLRERGTSFATQLDAALRRVGSRFDLW